MRPLGLGFVACASLFVVPLEVAALERGDIDRQARSTVAVCDDGGGGSCSLVCTGVLIAPRVVLTARHCVTGRASSMPSCEGDVEGPLLTPSARFAVSSEAEVGPTTPWTRVASVDVPAAVAPCGHDVALLTLASSLSDAPASVHVGPPATDFTLTGFGATSASGAGAGVRRSVVARLGCRSGEDACRAFAGGSLLAPGELLVEARACAGDSGGAAFSGAGAVAGVLSRSLESDGSCGVPIYTVTDRHLLWLARTVRAVVEADGGPVPDWIAAAERRGNGPGRSQGAPCNDDRDCDSNVCRSPDGDRSFVCATACGGGCPCQATRRGPACFEPREDGGCTASSAPAPRAGGIWTALVVLSAIVAYLRGRLAPFGTKRP